MDTYQYKGRVCVRMTATLVDMVAGPMIDWLGTPMIDWLGTPMIDWLSIQNHS